MRSHGKDMEGGTDEQHGYGSLRHDRVGKPGDEGQFDAGQDQLRVRRSPLL